VRRRNDASRRFDRWCAATRRRPELVGKVETVRRDGIMASVKVRMMSDEILTTTITREATEEMHLAACMEITVLIESSQVMLAIDD
jgi:molybdopterin-binding protein